MTEPSPTKIALGLGSNMGDRADALRKALAALSRYIEIDLVSDIYETQASYVTDQGPFLNAALVGSTLLEPLPLLWLMKDIESEIGRVPSFRNGPRLIDIDILFYGDVSVETPELTIPHRHMGERDFVLYPLSDIAASWKNPLTSLSVADMLKNLPLERPLNLGRL